MLNSNDTAKVMKSLAGDLIKRELPEIVASMDSQAKVDFVNSVKSLNEVVHEIEREVQARGGLVFLNTGNEHII